MNNYDIFKKINKILMDSDKPSQELKVLMSESCFDKEPFNKIKKLESIQQNKKYHPEGNVLNHTLLVVDKASEYKKYSNDKQSLMWAALLHDIGKLTTTRRIEDRIVSYNHDIEGEKLSKEILDEINPTDEEFNIKVSKLVRWHMQALFYEKNLPFFQPQNMINDVEYKEISLLSISDRLGRGNEDENYVKETKDMIKRFSKYLQDLVGGNE